MHCECVCEACWTCDHGRLSRSARLIPSENRHMSDVFLLLWSQWKQLGNYREVSSPDNTSCFPPLRCSPPPLFLCDASETHCAYSPVWNRMTHTHMMRIGTIKEVSAVTHRHSLLVWVCITCVPAHVLYQLLYIARCLSLRLLFVSASQFLPV